MQAIGSLGEYEQKELSFTEEEANILSKNYSKYIKVTRTESAFLAIAKHYVGTIVLPTRILVISPKIHNLNFFRMLFTIYNFNIDIMKEEAEYSKDEDILELIIEHFLYRVERLVKQGFSKGYVDEEDNLSCVKGRILVKEDLRHNPFVHSKAFCRFSEFTADIIENRIIKYTLFHLSKLRLENRYLQKRIRQALYFFDQVSLVQISAKRFPQITYTRLNERYRPTINWCQILIENSTLNLQKSGDIRCFSFLVDMNRLFENYLLTLLKKHLVDFDVRGMGHDMSGYSLDEAGKLSQKPDIVIKLGNTDLLIIDAKYKKLLENPKKQLKIIISDARQVWSYCLVNDRKLTNCILVYPKHWLLQQNCVTDYALKNKVQLAIKTIDLSIEDKEGFRKECDRFVGEIASMVRKEAQLCLGCLNS